MKRPPSQKAADPLPDPPAFLGTARVRELRRGAGRVVAKTLNLPVDLAQRIAVLAPTHRRSSDGLISGTFSDVAIDLLREALDHRAVQAEAAAQALRRTKRGAARKAR
jgi:hypothetical protein